MHEDLLLDLSRNLTYRTDIIKHATRYKNLLKLDFRDCKDCDVELCLEEYLALAPLPSSSSLKERQKRLAMRQQRLGAFQRVLNLVVDADLFVASPNKHYSHIEAKGTMYLTFVILANEGMKAEHQIARLKAGKPLFHELCGAFLLTHNKLAKMSAEVMSISLNILLDALGLRWKRCSQTVQANT